MTCRYQVWNRELPSHGNHGDIRVTTILKGALECCGADSDASGLCPEHAAFVADAKCPEVSKLDQKYWYRVPAKRKAKLGPSSVKETILPPDAAGRALRDNLENAKGSKANKEAFAAMVAYNKVRALKINEWRKPVWTAEDQAQKDAAEAAAHAKLMEEQAAFLERRAEAERKEAAKRAAAAISNAKREAEDAARAAAFPNVPAVQPGVKAESDEVERKADIGKGINYMGDKPDTRPIGKRAEKIDRTIDRMTALC